MDIATAGRLLGVPPFAGLDQVERAFRAAAAQVHPDHGGDGERFRQAVQAREVLRRHLGGSVRPVPGGRAPVIVVRRRTVARRLRDSFERRAQPPRVI